MVSLGFLGSSDQFSVHDRLVRVLPWDASTAMHGPAVVEIVLDRPRGTRWTLSWFVSPDSDREKWPRRMAMQLADLAWNPWRLDVDSLARTMGSTVEHSLLQWGEQFWDVYRADAVIYLDAGHRRRQVYQAVRHWQARFGHVRFSPEHDLDRAASGQQ